jgi:hypothetical protein
MAIGAAIGHSQNTNVYAVRLEGRVRHNKLQLAAKVGWAGIGGTVCQARA